MSVMLALVMQPLMYYGQNPIVRQRLEVKEPFQGAGAAAQPVTGKLDEANANQQPADAALANARQPYALLSDHLELAEGTPPYPTAARCYEGDFQRRLERTGNYRQMTNNYKRDVPDSCLQTPEEFIRAFYKSKDLPATDCLPSSQLSSKTPA